MASYKFLPSSDFAEFINSSLTKNEVLECLLGKRVLIGLIGQLADGFTCSAPVKLIEHYKQGQEIVIEVNGEYYLRLPITLISYISDVEE